MTKLPGSARLKNKPEIRNRTIDMKSLMNAPEVIIRRLLDPEPADNSRARIGNNLLRPPATRALSRSDLKDLRAAEMIAWQVTGGDYLRSRYAPLAS